MQMMTTIGKVNSIQEACTKCFAVHILKFEILQITGKKWNKEHQTLRFRFFMNRSSILMFLVLFVHVVCKISNSNMWTAKHLKKLLVLSWLYKNEVREVSLKQTIFKIFCRINSLKTNPFLTQNFFTWL